MDIYKKLFRLRTKATEQIPFLDAKKKRENALVLPFLAALGYDPFDVRDVEPEFRVELKEDGEKTVDFAAKKEEAPTILFSVESLGLGACDSAPLLRNMQESEARVGALTDGIEYRFYADLQRFYAVLKGKTIVEREPFLTFSLLDYSEREVKVLRQLSKPEIKPDAILSLAHHLTYARLFREYLQRQQENPDAAFVQFMMNEVHGGQAPKGDSGMYESSVREALRQLMKEAGGNPQDHTTSQRGTTNELPPASPEQSQGNRNDNDGDSSPETTGSHHQSLQESLQRRFRN